MHKKTLFTYTNVYNMEIQNTFGIFSFFFFSLHHTGNNHQNLHYGSPLWPFFINIYLLYSCCCCVVYPALLIHLTHDGCSKTLNILLMIYLIRICYGMRHFFSLDFNRRCEPFNIQHNIIFILSLYEARELSFFLLVSVSFFIWLIDSPQNRNLQSHQTIVFQLSLKTAIASEWASGTIACEIVYGGERWTH